MQMSITRALVELKRFDERTTRAIQEGLYVAIEVGRGDKSRIQGTTENRVQVGTKIQGSFDKVNDLIAQRAKIKSAIVKSNATTEVEVLGRKMTVAEAIEFKSQLPLMQSFQMNVSAQLTQARNTVERQNAVLNEQIEKAATAAVGDKTKVDTQLFESIANPRKDAAESKLFDPANAQVQLDKLAETISAIKSEIDFVLSESNARTVIEV